LLGCDPATPDRDAAETAGARDSAAAPILPEAPWFELPADWAEQHPTLSPNAHLDVHLRALAERQIEPDPADSAGRVWLESVTPIDPIRPAADDARAATAAATALAKRDRTPGSDPTARPALAASSRHRFTIGFEVGAPGIAEGGAIFVLPDPFWFWSEAQTEDPEAPGYTTAVLVAPRAAEPPSPMAATAPARLVPAALPGQLRIKGRALVAGERIEVVYGAGPAGAVVDRYADRGAELRIGIDADGDGQRAWIPEPIVVDVVANAPAELVAFGPAEVGPGDSFEIQLALVDAAGNRAAWPAEAVAAGGDARVAFEIVSLPAASQAPASGMGIRESLAPAEAPHRASLRAPTEAGILRLRVRGHGPLERFQVDLPPIVVRSAPTRLFWADLHGHTRYSDGSGTPDDYFRYARDVARLDAIALTDHDHWGIDPLDERPDRQAEILALARTYHAPGRFVTIPGYEWTSWLHGHRHVLAFEDALEIHSSIDPATDRPDELWAALRGRPALTFAHHSAGDPIATNWNFAPDPELEPVTEIASVHGMSEAADAPTPVTGALAGNFVRDVLIHGARLGFIGSGDSHDGHPGLAQIASGQGGLAGLFSEDLDRASLLAALKSRRTFATNGIRAWLEVSIDGVGMGGVLEPGEGEHDLRIRFEATAPIGRIDLVRTGHVASIEPPKQTPLSLDLERRIPRLAPGEHHYVRIVQADGGVAWSSPIFVEPRPAASRPRALEAPIPKEQVETERKSE
jgi:hypothetical protein